MRQALGYIRYSRPFPHLKRIRQSLRASAYNGMNDPKGRSTITDNPGDNRSNKRLVNPYSGQAGLPGEDASAYYDRENWQEPPSWVIGVGVLSLPTVIVICSPAVYAVRRMPAGMSRCLP